ncbi:alpha/beta hydrolase fold domain-containing protein [Streptomyces sp. NRRL B-1347]|uniref:alpha/beta hydrolase fold domain-containing protein n=1 Tax=Streptomyces sp. NRRL B-1347 TaxID=1476877 RepID=UPI00068EAC7C|nr:alpha/beta hydrolase fold domain-containing protein [Streptomyces sp. NRRL B-1347]
MVTSSAAVRTDEVTWRPLTVPAPSPVPVRVYEPGAGTGTGTGGWLVWAHGGSWQYGSAADWHPVTRRLAALTGWNVVSVDYRLAPAHRHPAALEDVLAVLDWAGERVGAGAGIAVGGDSAGATLAASAALAQRDRGRRLDAQLLAYPPLNPACAAPSYQRDPAAFPEAAALRRAWRTWRGTGPATAVAPDGTALHSTPFDAADLRGLAPAVLAVGTSDPVADDVLAYAGLLKAAAVPTRLIHTPDTAHADLLDPHSRLLPRLATALHDLP